MIQSLIFLVFLIIFIIFVFIFTDFKKEFSYLLDQKIGIITILLIVAFFVLNHFVLHISLSDIENLANKILE
ncbi:hypothetical protein [Lachnospira multipara]|uniref:Uncharacterized protein n=1 Tax=Lachnospira multipara TaxID=28051 RepID=A0A1H5WXJ9_9FIRM|nr:hypothetical protein [Lachnospira multipara]SEG03985.1 hypothetical protein SAMN05216537_11927 [Lachnospira multipara]